MSPDELNSWLLSNGVREEIEALIRITVRSELDNLVSDDEDAEDFTPDWRRLLFAGSLLARSNMRLHQEAALRIATAAITLKTPGTIRDAGAVLLNKLSNFRAVELAQKRDLLEADLNGRLGITLKIEIQRRRIDKSVLIQSSGRWLSVNDFQQSFWSKANSYDWLSASAPTASGKTFLVLQWLIDHMRSTPSKVAIYLAPTRALVSEIEVELNALLGKNSGIEVSSLPLREKYNNATKENATKETTKLILVYTQERLHLLVNAPGDDIHVDLLIVDEAHKIGDHQRGIILQDAIERLARLNPPLKVVFISPATENPAELLADAPVEAKKDVVDSDSPTVLQNLIIAEQAPRKPEQWNLSARSGDSTLHVGILQLANRPNTLKKKPAFIAAAAGERGGTLVYANGAAEAEEIADLISQYGSRLEVRDEELEALADLAQKGVHPDFTLAALVKRGVAFHYGNMPSLIRLEVERLFKNGKIRFLVCTSTLVEGVNLSCRTIVLRGPRKGKGRPMEPHDFWNLAGRAGRWGNEFQGNIICIDPRDNKAWPSGVPKRSRHMIKRESDAVLEDGDRMADYLALRAATPLDQLDDDDIEQFEQVGAYLLATYLRLGSISQAGFAKRHSPERIAKLEEILKSLAGKVGIGHETTDRHPGVSAVGLQKLLEAFRAYKGDPEDLLPAPAESNDSFERFVTIMQMINKHLYPAFVPNQAVRLYALTIVQWLKGYSLAKMIQGSINYNSLNGKPFKLPQLIRQTMERVEQIARFKAPKYLSAYRDVLYIYLAEINRKDLINDDEMDIGTQLEFGVSSRTQLSLMEPGLSRMSAVYLYEKIASDDLIKEQRLHWVRTKESRLDHLDLPAVIVREIREKLFANTAP